MAWKNDEWMKFERERDTKTHTNIATATTTANLWMNEWRMTLDDETVIWKQATRKRKPFEYLLRNFPNTTIIGNINSECQQRLLRYDGLSADA